MQPPSEFENRSQDHRSQVARPGRTELLTGSETGSEYRCPDEPSPIGRAIHLGRLARFYPPCRQCAHRDDTGPLTTARQRQRAEVRPAGLGPAQWLDNTLVGVYPNQIGAREARGVASAFGLWLRRQSPCGTAPLVVLAGDGRPRSAEVLSAACEGLRWAACAVSEIGPATSACLAFAMDHLQAAGGLLVGSALQQPHAMGLRLRLNGPSPARLDWSRELCQAELGAWRGGGDGVNRPARRYGPHERFAADEPYLADLAAHYHGLRPLRFVLHTDSLPLVHYIKTLCARVACQAIEAKARSRLGDDIRRTSAHFGLRVENDGETAALFDQRGEPVAPERFFLLVAGYLLQDQPQAKVLLEEGSEPRLASVLSAAGAAVSWAEPGRTAMETGLRSHGALLAGGPSGRFWYALGHPSPDALRTLTLLLVLLSRSDRRLSDVLDADARLS